MPGENQVASFMVESIDTMKIHAIVIAIVLGAALGTQAAPTGAAIGSAPAQTAPSAQQKIAPPGLNKMPPAQNNQNNNVNQNGMVNTNGSLNQNGVINQNGTVNPNRTGNPNGTINPGAINSAVVTPNGNFPQAGFQGIRPNTGAPTLATNFPYPQAYQAGPLFTNKTPNPPQVYSNLPPMYTNRPPIWTNPPTF
jgi:hypothetical protein